MKWPSELYTRIEIVFEISVLFYKYFLRLRGSKRTTEGTRQVFWKASDAGHIAGTDIHAYWYTRKPLAVDVETTAYALLAEITIAKFKNPGEFYNCCVAHRPHINHFRSLSSTFNS